MRARDTAIACTAGIIVLASALRVGAQLDQLKNTTPKERATAQTAMMVSKLGLTPEQRPKIAELNLKYANQIQPILTGSEGPLGKMRQIRQIQEQKEAELKQVLSPAQFQQYLAMKEQMREQLEERIEEKGKAGDP
jgi:hypothetical protein